MSEESPDLSGDREVFDGPASGSAGAARNPERTAGRIDELTERLDDIESTLESEIDRRQSLDAVTEVMAERLSDVAAELDELATELDSTHESLAEEYESLAEEYESLDADVDSLETELGREKDARASEQQKLAAEQERIRTWLDSEFSDLETVLEYLVSRTDDLEADMERVDAQYENVVSRFRWERDALDSLKRDAAVFGAHTGECESCSETVDLDLLSRPYCLNCESILTGVEERDKWLFFSKAVVTTEGNGGGANADESSNPDTGTRERQDVSMSSPTQGEPGQETDAQSADTERPAPTEPTDQDSAEEQQRVAGNEESGATEGSSPAEGEGTPTDDGGTSPASREHEPDEAIGTDDGSFEFGEKVGESPFDDPPGESETLDDSESGPEDGDPEQDTEVADSDIGSTVHDLGESVR